MKTIKISILYILVLLFSSCQKYFETPFTEGNATKEQIMNNAQIVKGIVNAAYGYIPDRYNALDGSGAMLASGCDEAVNSNLNSTVNILGNGIWGPQRTIDDMYSNMYTGIRKANIVLENIAKSAVQPINATISRDSTIHRMKAEAYFLRAYYHFELVKRYGGVVIVKRVFGRDEDLNVSRNTFDECVAQIVSDCDSAIISLPLWTQSYNASSDTKEMGRVTKCAAMALKARTLLYAASPLYNQANSISKWQRAADAAKVLIDQNTHSLLPLVNYGNIFNFSAAAYNAEVIFAGQPNDRNDIETLNAPVSFDGASGRTNPTQELVDAFEMKSTGLPITDPLSGYDPAKPYDNRDPRLALAILYNGSKYKNITVETFVGGKDGLNLNINATKTGYYMKKFLSDNVKWNQSSNATQRRPWVIFRYAEVLLNYAEALNEAQGPVNDVYKCVNMIRQRVNMPVLPTGLSQSQMRDRIRNERRVELCFEEHRFFDVRRWKIGNECLNKPVTGMKITMVNNQPVYERFQVVKRVFSDKMNLFPIPQTEINCASKLQQNPGW